MKELRDYFVSKQQAESLKELGFNDSCLAHYNNYGDFYISPNPTKTNAPLIVQAMDWLQAELCVTIADVNDGIEKLKIVRKKLTITVTLTFEVYQKNKTYEDGDYLIIKDDEDYPISVSIAYGQMIDCNGSSFDDYTVALISPSFEVTR